MFLTIVIAVAALVLFLGAVILFSPFVVRLDFSVNGFRATGGGVISFIHPAIISVAVDFSDRKGRVSILGRQWGKKKKKEAEETPGFAGSEPPEEEKPETYVLSPAAGTPVVQPEVSPPVSVPEQGELQDTSIAAPEVVTEKAGAAEVKADHRVPEPPEPQIPAVVEPSGSFSAEPGSETFFQPSTEDEDATPGATEHSEEKVVPSGKKKDNWFRRLERNRYLFFIRNAGWRSKVLRWLVRVIGTFFHIVRFDRFRLAIRAGVSDPVLTGTFSGMYQALRYGLPLRHPKEFSFEPVFMRNHFECGGSIRVATALSRILLPVIVAVVTFPIAHTLRLVWCVYRRERRYRKEAAE
ncbi:MAG: hypothetical protein JW863_19465 [Chitinispirillaceae bacterium]|nr:hypothetical protein [Chitinispirillaceae bacterium]